MMAVTHFSDPACPWAYSAGPAFAVLRWRYGARLRWRHVMIGLGETREHYRRRGTTGESQARSYRSFRRRGMPFATEPRDGPHATWPMCRVVVAARGRAPEREWAVFRAFQLAQFTSTLALDEPAGIERALAWVPGIDAAALIAASTEPETDEQFAADRALARSAAGGATEFQGRSATTPEGEVRFTAPSLIFTAADGRSVEVGGFQPLEAYDVAIANLDRSLERRPPADDAADVLAAFPDGLTTAEVAAVMCPHLQPLEAYDVAIANLDRSLERRPPADDAADVLAAFPDGLTTAEVAAVMAPHLHDPDRDAAEDGLIAAVAAGAAHRRPFGNDALWTPASVATGALAA